MLFLYKWLVVVVTSDFVKGTKKAAKPMANDFVRHPA